MSNFLTGLSQLNPQVKRHNGGTTTLTLDQNGTTNATMLYVNGVAQTPGIDFNVSGATLTTTSTLPAGTNICTTIQYFNTGIVNTVADNAIGLGQMASGVDGNVISYDSSGNPVAVATGSDGQVLTSTGAGSPPAFEALPAAAAPALSYVSTINASGASTVDIAGLEDGFDYQIMGTGISYSSNSLLKLTVGVSGPTFRTSGYLSYGWGNIFNGSGAGTVTYGNEQTAYISNTNYGYLANNPVQYRFDLRAPMTSSVKTSCLTTSGGEGAGVDRQTSFGEGLYNTAEANDRIRFTTSAGSFNGGTFRVYKLAHS